jgi:hypothetical protein
VVWTNTARSAAVPRLSVPDGKIYTVTRHGLLGSEDTAPTDTYTYAVIDAATGATESEQFIGATTVQDTLQTVGTIAPGRIQYQGTVSGLFRIVPR